MMKDEMIKGAMKKKHLIWLLMLNLHSAQYVMIELLDHPQTRQREKQQINIRKRWVENWIRQSTRKEDRETIEDCTSEHIGYMAELQMMLGLCHPDQLEWITEQVAKLIIAANNREQFKKQ
jgi:3-deoxy-D-manno-octulosonic-acid transferase